MKKSSRHLAFIAGLFGLAVAVALPSRTLASGGKGGLRYSVSVWEFDNNGHCDYDLGHAWSTQLTTALHNSDRFLVVAEVDMQAAALAEQGKAALGVTAQGRKTPVRSQMTPSQILIKGVITQCKQNAANQGGGLNLGKIRVGTDRRRTDIRANLQMIDSTTGRVIASKAFTATAQQRKFVLGGYNQGDSGNVDLGEDDKVQEALDEAITEVIPWLESQLPAVPWRGTIAKVRPDGQVIVNRGSQEGVSPGLVLVAGESEILRDPDTGDVLTEELFERARLRVERVLDKASYCTVIGGDGGLLIEGMAVQLVE